MDIQYQYTKNDPLLNSPNSLTVECVNCKKNMNNNYYYRVDYQGSASGYVCPKCYCQITPNTRRYVKYVYIPRKYRAPKEPNCPLCPIL